MTCPLAGAGGDSGAPTINTEKSQRWAPWGDDEDLEAPTINIEKTSTTDPLGGGAGDLRAPTINTENINGGPPRR
jgi:hypothetical protein